MSLHIAKDKIGDIYSENCYYFQVYNDTTSVINSSSKDLTLSLANQNKTVVLKDKSSKR